IRLFERAMEILQCNCCIVEPTTLSRSALIALSHHFPLELKLFSWPLAPPDTDLKSDYFAQNHIGRARALQTGHLGCGGVEPQRSTDVVTSMRHLLATELRAGLHLLMRKLPLLALIAFGREATAEGLQCAHERAVMVEVIRAHARSDAALL